MKIKLSDLKGITVKGVTYPTEELCEVTFVGGGVKLRYSGGDVHDLKAASDEVEFIFEKI